LARRSRVIIEADAGFKPQGMNLTVVSATDDQGRDLWHPSGIPWAAHYSVEFANVQDDIKFHHRLDFDNHESVAVHLQGQEHDAPAALPGASGAVMAAPILFQFTVSSSASLPAKGPQTGQKSLPAGRGARNQLENPDLILPKEKR